MSEPTDHGQPASPRVTMRRGTNRQEYGRDELLAVLDAGMVAHVGVIRGAATKVEGEEKVEALRLMTPSTTRLTNLFWSK